MKRLLVSLIVSVLLASSASAYRDKRIDEAARKAVEQVRRGHPETGLALLARTAERIATGESLLALARLQLRLGLVDEAALTFDRARERGASEPEVLAAVASFQLATGPAEDARANAEAAVALASTPETLATLARVRTRANDLNAARELLAKAAAGPPCALVLVAEGERAARSGRHADALEAFGKALDLDAATVDARVGRALSMLALGRTSEAVAEARRAASEDPSSSDAQAALALASLAPDPGAWNRAITLAQQAAAQNPRSAFAHEAVGRVFAAAREAAKAIAALERAIALDPDRLSARVALAEQRVAQGDVAGAAQAAQALAEDAPWLAAAQWLHGRELLRKKDAAGAREALRRAVTLDPGHAEAHALLASAAFLLDDTAEAVAAARRALEIEPQNLRWRADYGLFLGRAGEYEAALAELAKVVAAPGYREAAGWANLGWVHRMSRPARPEESIRAYGRALEIDPSERQAALGLGWAFFAAQRYGESIQAYERALTIDPASAGEAYDGMGWGFYFLQDTEKARAFGEKARAAGHDDPQLFQTIARFEGLRRRSRDRQQEVQGALQLAARCHALEADTHHRQAKVRADAVAALSGSGCPGTLETLESVLYRDLDLTVKGAAADALGAMGAVAVPAIVYLEPYARPCPMNPLASPAEMEREEACQKLRGKSARALERIRR